MPARGRVDDDELAAERRDLAHVAIPVEQATVEAAHVLNERYSPVQPGLADHATDGLAELHDDRLLRLVDDECRAAEDEQN